MCDDWCFLCLDNNVIIILTQYWRTSLFRIVIIKMEYHLRKRFFRLIKKMPLNEFHYPIWRSNFYCIAYVQSFKPLFWVKTYVTSTTATTTTESYDRYTTFSTGTTTSTTSSAEQSEFIAKNKTELIVLSAVSASFAYSTYCRLL